MIDVTNLFDWLLRGAPGVSDASQLCNRLGLGLLEAGVPVDRLVAFIRSIHPLIRTWRVQWAPGGQCKVAEVPHTIVKTADFHGSPVDLVLRAGQSFRWKLSNDQRIREHALLDSLAVSGITDYLALPIQFTDGENHTLTLATRHPMGFDDAQIDAVNKIMLPFSRVVEAMALRRTAVNLLNTYVGRNAGEHILAGKIRPGDTELIQAVIWFSDLRGFTELSSAISSKALIQTLNEVFDCQVSAIERHGGEVLKYIGDGLLAIFPTIANSEEKACREALDAAKEAFGALESLNEQRAARGDVKVRFGLALHIGEVAYGNIGGGPRLDFTCIGPAVNLAARLEGLTGKLKRDIVASSAFSALVQQPMAEVGSFLLKGITEPEKVFAPV